MSRCLKCSSCGDDIEIGENMYKINGECFCNMCVDEDILDETYFEDDDSHAVLEEKILKQYE